MKSYNPPLIVKASQLHLADVVRSGNSPFDTAIVKRIRENGDVVLFRPYGATADFSMAGNQVICYVGIEEYTVYPDTEMELLERRSLR